MRILVLEANTRLFTEHTLRYMKLLLPMDQIELAHAANLTEAAAHLETGIFDVIIYDFHLGKPITKEVVDEKGKPVTFVIRNAAELCKCRVAAEQAGALPKSLHVLFTSTVVAARRFGGLQVASFSKLNVVELMLFLKARLPQPEKSESKKEVAVG